MRSQISVRKKRSGHIEFLVLIAIIGMVLALLIPLIRALRYYLTGEVPPPPKEFHFVDFLKFIGCIVSMYGVLGVSAFAEFRSERIGLGVDQWSIRSIVERIGYLLTAIPLGIYLMHFRFGYPGEDVLATLAICLSGLLVLPFLYRLRVLGTAQAFSMFGLSLLPLAISTWCFVFHPGPDAHPATSGYVILLVVTTWLLICCFATLRSIGHAPRVLPEFDPVIRHRSHMR